jgi:predicted ArsR family transcriptional regulator
MGQADILKVLEKKHKASAEEIAEVLEISMDAVRKSLNRLLKAHDVERIMLTKEEVEKIGVKFNNRHFLWMIKIEDD